MELQTVLHESTLVVVSFPRGRMTVIAVGDGTNPADADTSADGDD